MTHEMQTKGSPAAPVRRRRNAPMHWLKVGAIALVSLVCAGTAWADTLALASGAGQSGLGGSSSAQPLVVQVLDANGAAIAGRTIDWTSSNGFGLSQAFSVTDANGLASVNFTYGNYGTTAIVATDPAGSTSTQANETSTGSDSVTVISGNNQAGQPGTTSTQPIVVQVLDASGHSVAGRTVDWTDQTAFTHVAAPTSVTDGSGEASMNFTYLEGTSGGGSVATIRAADSIGTAYANAKATTLGYDKISIGSGANQSGLVGSSCTPIVAHVNDGNGNPIPGAAVAWTQKSGPPGAVMLSNANTSTDPSGNTSITCQFLQPGAGVIGAQLVSNGVQTSARFVIVSAASLTLVSPSGVSGSPGTTASVEVQSLKADGTPEITGTVKWAVLGGNATVSAPSSTTNSNGQATITVTFGTSNSLLFATDVATGLQVQDIPLNSVSPNGSLQLVSGQNQSGTAGSPAAQPVVVQLLSPSGAPLTGHTITWSILSGSSVRLLNTTSLTDVNGRAHVNFDYVQAGSAQIVATTDLVPDEDQQVIVTESALGLSTIKVVSGSGQSGLAGTPGVQQLVVQENDASGNPVAGRTITWTAVSGGAKVAGSTSSSSPPTGSNGQASISFTYGPAAGIDAIQAADLALVNGNIASFGVRALNANALNEVSGNGQAGLINSNSAQPLVVEVLDAAGNPVNGRTINWTTIKGAARPLSTSSVTMNGKASVGFSYGATPSTSTLVATDAVTGQKVAFTVTGSAPGYHVMIASGDGQDGLPGTPGPQPIVIELLDATNQPVAGHGPLTWSVVSGSATLGMVTTVFDSRGQAKANFNFGTAAGTSIIQVTGAGPNPQLVQASVTTLPASAAQLLTIVSGNGQVLNGAIASAAMVVQLKNASNAPVAGATVYWTATNGNLQAATSVTNGNGQAINTVSASASGAVVVHASTALASTPVTFTMSSALASLPNLTPAESAVAGALDQACAALEVKANLTPAQQDLLARCQNLQVASGIDQTATADALGQLVTETAAAQSNAAVTAATAQFQNITLRLNALRSSSNTDSLAADNASSLNGLSFAGPGGVIPVASLMGALLGDGNTSVADKQSGSGSSRWGFFATGTIGTGAADARSMSPAYNYDINGLTAGVDYRQRDNWVSGVAVGYSHQNTNLQNANLENDAGNILMNGWNVSTYSTWSFHNNLYVDGVLTWGNNSFDLSRQINYYLPGSGGGTTINQIATAHPGGSLFSAALTFGGDFHKDAWSFSPYAQLISSRMDFDGYQESTLAGPGNGLGLTVDARTVNSFDSVLGTKISYANSTSWGVFIPTASLEWQHEFNSDEQAVTAHFTNDPLQTPFSVFGDPLQNSFIRFGLGASFVMSQGRSGFILYEHTFGQDGVRQDNLGFGIRIEF
jgi:uncharacterized protein with beta-barrel porin domain